MEKGAGRDKVVYDLRIIMKGRSMKEKLKELPGALQKQILYRFALGAGFFLLAFVIVALFRDLYLCLPCVLLAGGFGVSGSRILFHGLEGSYVCIEGICRRIERGRVHGRIKSITLTLKQGTLRIPVRQRMGKLVVGDTVAVYLAMDTPVYERNDGYEIISCYAMEVLR